MLNEKGFTAVGEYDEIRNNDDDAIAYNSLLNFAFNDANRLTEVSYNTVELFTIVR